MYILPLRWLCHTHTLAVIESLHRKPVQSCLRTSVGGREEVEERRGRGVKGEQEGGERRGEGREESKMYTRKIAPKF